MGFYKNLILIILHYEWCNFVVECASLATSVASLLQCFFPSFFLYYFSLFCLHILGAEGYYCTWSHTHTHTHTHSRSRAYSVGPLCARDRPLATHKIHKRIIHATGHIPTRTASNQAAADLRLRPRDHWNWRLWSYKWQIGRGSLIVKWVLLLNRWRLCVGTLIESCYHTYVL